MMFQTFGNQSFKKTSYYQQMPLAEQEIFDVLTQVFHFKTNEYVLKHLIDWSRVPDDPIYKLNFLNPQMLSEEVYQSLWAAHKRGDNSVAKNIRQQKQARVNVHADLIPGFKTPNLWGVYHPFKTLINLFPAPMEKTCHAYCSYCFRWKQFVPLDTPESDFTYTDPQTPIPYLRANPEITDVLFTGADPLVLPAQLIRQFVEPVLAVDTLKVVRISSKSLAWWPYRFTTDKDADDLLRVFETIVSQGKHLNFCAHFTHVRELENPVVQEAIRRIQNTGAIIRCQGPIVEGINDTAQDWIDLWSAQVALGMIPYYMFIEADHNNEASFRIPLAKAFNVFQTARSNTTALARTARGPVFMNDIHRIQLDGVVELNNEKFFALKCLQSPYTQMEGQIRLIPYDEKTRSIDNLIEMFIPKMQVEV